MLNRRHFIAVAMFLSSVAKSYAEDFPNRPIRLVVPLAPGGSTDILARLIADPLGKELGQAVIVDNRPGASGVVGTREVSRATPDGYTLLMATVSSFVVYPAVARQPVYSIDQFTPISKYAAMPNVLSVNPAFPAQNLEELIKVLRDAPDKYTFASSGEGSINHVLGEVFQELAKVKIRHVPYRGSGPALNDVMGGQVDMLFDQLPASKPYLESNKLRPIAMISPHRAPDFPNVPTMEEGGLKGFTTEAWYGMVAPAKCPPQVIERLIQAVQKVVSEPNFQARIRSIGAQPIQVMGTDFGKELTTDIATMKELIVNRGITL